MDPLLAVFITVTMVICIIVTVVKYMDQKSTFAIAIFGWFAALFWWANYVGAITHWK